MIFTDKDIQYITKVLYNVYSLARKKKLRNVPDTFEMFIKQNVEEGLCPDKCIAYTNIQIYNYTFNKSNTKVI